MPELMHIVYFIAGGSAFAVVSYVAARIVTYQLKKWAREQFDALHPVTRTDLEAVLKDHEDVEKRLSEAQYNQFLTLVTQHQTAALQKIDEARRLALTLAGNYAAVSQAVSRVEVRVGRLERKNSGAENDG